MSEQLIDDTLFQNLLQTAALKLSAEEAAILKKELNEQVGKNHSSIGFNSAAGRNRTGDPWKSIPAGDPLRIKGRHLHSI